MTTAGLALASALWLAAFQPGSVRADEPQPKDVFGLGLDLSAMCDLTPGAPVSDRCYGFLGAIVEMALSSEGLREQGFDETSFLFVRTCIPADLKLDEIIEAIRSHFVATCTGLCTETGYVLSALESAYPCLEED
jgi:hypothetical protein